MKDVKIFLGETTNTTLSTAILSIKSFLNNLEENIKIVVPDKLDLLTEQAIFSVLNEESCFNIEVINLNTLIEQVLNDTGFNASCYSREQSIFLIRLAIQKVKNKFLCFGKRISYNLCEEMYSTINQLQTSKITCDDFIVTNEKLNLNKYHDIKLVYEEYTKLLNGKQDNTELLNIFNDYAKNSNLLKNLRIMFLGFDSLTNQELFVMKTIINFAKSFYISIPISDNDNSYLYDKSILNYLKTMETEQNINITYIQCEKKFNKQDEKSYLFKNLYTGKIESNLEQNSYANIIEATTMQDEISFAGKTIVYQIKENGKSFSDFTVFCPNNYFNELKQIFNEYQINFYIDNQKSLKDIDFVKFIVNLIEFFDDKNYDNFKKLLYFNFLKIEKENIEKINQIILYKEEFNFSEININLSENYNKLINNLILIDEKFKNYTKNTLKIENICEIIEFLINIFNFKKEIFSSCEKFTNNNEIFLSKLYSQLYNKICEIIEDLKTYMPKEEISLFDFLEIFNAVISNKTIKTSQISLDCVRVVSPGEYILNTNILFILGANEGELPVCVKDSRLISDQEAEIINLKYKIEPTAKTINKRNKYKLFESLFSANEKLFITYHKVLPDGKEGFSSGFVDDIIKCYKKFNLTKTKNLFSYVNTVQNSTDKFLFNSVNLTHLKNSFGEIDSGDNKNLVKNILIEQGEHFEYKSNQDIENAEKLFFKKGTTKISELEKYFTCPMANFFAYGLNLKKKRTGTIESTEYGTYIHKILENFIGYHGSRLENLTDTKILEWIENEIDYLKNDEKYGNIYKKSNFIIINLLKQEIFRVCLFIRDEQQISYFKVNKEFLEFKFDKENSLKLSFNDKTIDLVGIIDRVDFNGEYFRILDYKTGSGKSYDGLKDIYTGKKIQTMLYFKALENITAKKCFGVFYFPIKCGYLSSDESAYKMNGIYLKDADLVMSADKTLGEDNLSSNFFNTRLSKADIKKTGKLSVSGNCSGALSYDEFNTISVYTKSICEKAITEMTSGFISASPISGACEYCEYSIFCKYFKNDLITRDFKFDVDKTSFNLEEK